MMLKKRGVVFALSIAIVLFFVSLNLAAAADVNATLFEKQAGLCINESKVIMQSMVDDGFNVLSINDSLKQAEATFLSQSVLEEKKRPYDFSLVIPYCDNIKKIREDALAARDDYNSLMKFYNESIVPGMNTSTIDVMINEIRGDINSERYTETGTLINKAYTEITSVKSSYTSLNLFYQSTSRGLKSFLLSKNQVLQITNWQFLLGLVVFILIALLFYRVRIMKMMLERKLRKLQNRKKTIKELIMQTQKDYFQYGKIPEAEYNIKTKRFAELIRDIDRQIPMLQEGILKLGGTRETQIEKEMKREVASSHKELVRRKIQHITPHRTISHKKHVIQHKKIIKKKKL